MSEADDLQFEEEGYARTGNVLAADALMPEDQACRTAAKRRTATPRANSLRIPFGLSLEDGQLYEPRSVPLGKACNCVCPSCKRTLYSKHCLGEKVAPHFQHAPGVECAKGYETAVHLAAKQLIDEERRLVFPELIAKVEVRDALGIPQEASRRLAPGGIRILEDVALEQRVGRIRPDLIVDAIGAGRILVEIAVTHFVDHEKLLKIAESEIPVLEIDVSEFRTASFEELRKSLFDDPSNSKWLFHPQIGVAEVGLKLSLQPALLKAAEVARERDEKAKEWARHWEQQRAEAEKERAAAQREQAALDLIKRKAKHEELKRASGFKARTEQEKVQILTRRLGVSMLPEAVKIRGRGGRSFGVSNPHVWQATLFGGLIDGQASAGHSWVKKDFAVSWLRYRFEITPEFSQSERIAVWDYLVGLSERGALFRRRRDYFNIGVASLSAFETLTDFKSGRITLDSGLEWTAEQSWPTRTTATVLAHAHADSLYIDGRWEQLSTLLPIVRGRTPREITRLYANQFMSETEIVAYLISTGFLVRTQAL